MQTLTHLEIVGGPHDDRHIMVEDRVLEQHGGYLCLGVGRQDVYQRRGIQLVHLGFSFARGGEDRPFELQELCEGGVWRPFAVEAEMHGVAQDAEINQGQWRVVNRGEVVYPYEMREAV